MCSIYLYYIEWMNENGINYWMNIVEWINDWMNSKMNEWIKKWINE